ncbi:MAG TPA: tetratricopeptide repeat protein [Gemmataceae bacterium]|nr:tetratricopeptide repeat protein [Gemmataceae bacterium]
MLCPLLTVWVVGLVHGPERARAQQTLQERDQAEKAEKEAQRQLEQAVSERKKVIEQRDNAVAEEKAARSSQKITKAVLNFLKDKVFAAEHRKGGGKAAGKEVTLRQAVDAAEPKVSEEFADRQLVEASIREILGFTYRALGDSARAVPQYERALALREAVLGPDAEASNECRNQLAVAYRAVGRTDDASRLFNENRLSPGYAAALSVQGAALLAQNEAFQAELKLRESLAIRQRKQPDDWATFDTMSLLGEALVDQKKYAKAEPMLVSGYEGMKQRESKIPLGVKQARLTKALQRLVHLYVALGKQDQAAKWRKELQSVETPK